MRWVDAMWACLSNSVQVAVAKYHSVTLQWRHNERDGVSNHQPRHCLLSRLFRCRSKKTSKLRVTSLCAGNSPGTGEFPAQMASNAENVSFWWRHHDIDYYQSQFNQNATSKATPSLLISGMVKIFHLSLPSFVHLRWQVATDIFVKLLTVRIWQWTVLTLLYIYIYIYTYIWVQMRWYNNEIAIFAISYRDSVLSENCVSVDVI